MSQVLFTIASISSKVSFLAVSTVAILAVFTTVFVLSGIYDIYGKVDKHRCGQVDINGAN